MGPGVDSLCPLAAWKTVVAGCPPGKGYGQRCKSGGAVTVLAILPVRQAKLEEWHLVLPGSLYCYSVT